MEDEIKTYVLGVGDEVFALLQRLGIRCVELVEPHLDVLEREQYFLLITKQELKTTTGMHLVKKIREKNEDAQIIIISNNVSLDMLREGISWGVRRIITEPIDENELEVSIKSALEMLTNIRRMREKLMRLKMENERIKKMTEQIDYSVEGEKK